MSKLGLVEKMAVRITIKCMLRELREVEKKRDEAVEKLKSMMGEHCYEQFRAGLWPPATLTSIRGYRPRKTVLTPGKVAAALSSQAAGAAAETRQDGQEPSLPPPAEPKPSEAASIAEGLDEIEGQGFGLHRPKERKHSQHPAADTAGTDV